jgi:Protein of unknown function (DUF3631)
MTEGIDRSDELLEWYAEDHVDGAELLDDVRDTIARYCVLPGVHELIAVVLWCVLTHLVDRFDYAPRLVIRSAEKRSGKSRLLEVIAHLVRAPLRAVNVTTAYLFRSLDVDPNRTLLFDEADTVFGAKAKDEANEDVRAFLNAGFQRGLPFGRTVGPKHEPTEFSTFAMAALAGIGRMPDTIEDRGVVIAIKRRAPSETVAPYRIGRDGPVLNQLRNSIAGWAESVRYQAGETSPELPIEDRAADVWEPLVAIADLAGGDWPRLAREAAKALVDTASEDDTARSINLQLLEDIRSVFGSEFMKSSELCTKLRQLTESPWEQFDLSPSKLGRRLREYGIKARHSRDKSERGYHRTDFADGFARYLKPSEGVPQEPKVSHENRESENIPDTLDTYGHLFEGQGDQTEVAGDPSPPPSAGEKKVSQASGGVRQYSDQHHQSDTFQAPNMSGAHPETNGHPVAGEPKSRCTDCGQAMVHPTSVVRGYCEGCRLRRNRSEVS